MKVAPRVSVVTASFNRAHTIERALASVQAQDISDWQHIIVDDGSTDDTPALLARLSGDERYCCLRQKNAGCIASLNRGAALARGDYLAFLDSDDELLPHHLSSSIEAGADLVWGAAAAVGPEAAQYYVDLDHPGQRAHVSGCCLNTGLVIRRSIWERLQGYRNLLSFDADFKARALVAGARAVMRTRASVIVHCEGSDRLSDVVRDLNGTNAGTTTSMPDQQIVHDRMRKRE